MFDNGAGCVAESGTSREWESKEEMKMLKNCDKGLEGRRVRICMREKGYEDGEESGGLRSEESRRDEWNDNGNEVERCWEDVAVVEGRLVADESALKGCNECCKVGESRGSCRRG